MSPFSMSQGYILSPCPDNSSASNLLDGKSRRVHVPPDSMPEFGLENHTKEPAPFKKSIPESDGSESGGQSSSPTSFMIGYTAEKGPYLDLLTLRLEDYMDLIPNQNTNIDTELEEDWASENIHVADMEILLDHVFESQEPDMPFYFPGGGSRAQQHSRSPSFYLNEGSIYLTTDGRRYTSIYISDEMKGADIKEMISERLEIPVENQLLIYRIGPLGSDEPLDDDDISDLCCESDLEKEILKFFISWSPLTRKRYVNTRTSPTVNHESETGHPSSEISIPPLKSLSHLNQHCPEQLGAKRKSETIEESDTFGPARKKIRTEVSPSYSYRSSSRGSSYQSSVSPCYSLASSRTASTDYGVYFTRRAFSLEEESDYSTSEFGMSVLKEEED
ncbi:hypothetical protein CPB84DRAFT_1785867 [Gymnopilus junonius]|uniref:Ubiquitin-like domain-containing protein n=1 Tax=Gymnopilus junonius TaxID=109634 RepID=A0A9P5NKL1_GYMJU|nr:hypothetical protein CPB84DRAFT_1785867 [Gymnopilus junonius]